ncbi:helix-turn-helix transcriptional regulator [Aurantimicrobium minutum]|uniref:helix-turn-helix transcriptional regulator n=1 Tax=Aurantimicrobium minutum TaxID=708131 RepID=UPI00248ED97E|nr:helix-turn-helix transcriptional regulator [Aurantimicrobium minutum]
MTELNEANAASHDFGQDAMLSFSKKVRDFRKMRGLTQQELADNAQVDRKTISRIENSAYSPSLTSLFSIAKALEVDPRELL